MEVSSTAREARLLVESSIEALKESPDKVNGAKFNLSFEIQLAPGLKTDSETLSYLDKVLRAVRQFSDKEPMRLVLNIPMMHPEQVEVLNGIRTRYEKVVSIGEPAANSGLVVPPSMASGE
jgi:hypothetical protein